MVEARSLPQRWFAAPIRLAVLTGIVTALILPALFMTQHASAAGTPSAPPHGDTRIDSGCTIDNTNDKNISADNAPLQFLGNNVAGYAGDGVLKSQADAVADGCAMTTTFTDTITIGAGTSGLAQGALVTLQVTLAVDGTLSVEAGSGYAEATAELDYSIESPYMCPEGCPSAVLFTVDVQNQNDNSGRTYWNLTTNSGVGLGSYSNTPSEGIDTGTQTVVFTTAVGETLAISGRLNAFATGNNGGHAISNFYDGLADGFSSTRIVPAAGSAGVEVIYGSEPAPNQAPSVDAAGPYSVNEGATVQVSATGTDPEGDALTYAWDLNGDGTFETAGQSATFSAAGINGPATATIAVQATDTAGNLATDTATVNVLDVAPTGPAQMIANLIAAVDNANIHPGTETALLGKLQAAKSSAEAVNVTGACDSLKAFVNQVNAQQGKKITTALANDWISQATAIRTALGCS